MNLFKPDVLSKQIKSRELMIKYRKALRDNEKWEGSAPLGEGPANRDGMPKLPPGQKTTARWPVLDLGVQPEIPLKNWLLTVSGLVGNPQSFTWDQYMALPQTEDVSDFHCVTTWSKMDNHWVGVKFADIISQCDVQPEAKFVYIKAYDGYSTNLPLAEALKYDVLLVHQWEGKPLPKEHGGPVRMITPQLYAWKGAKWIGEIIFRDKDELGFWEKRGYSNTAEPWLNDRYS
ncbi:MAG: sulfite oxidase-like oxidoreductase [Nitrospinaceae bacterium]